MHIAVSVSSSSLSCSSLSLRCRQAPSPEAAHPLPADHAQQVEQWRAKHEADYRRDWVSVAGLHPLKQGPNTAGTAPGNDIRLSGALPPQLGTFTLQGQEVRFAPAAGAAVTLKDGEPVTSPIVLEDDSTTPLGRAPGRRRSTGHPQERRHARRCACAIPTARSPRASSASSGSPSTHATASSGGSSAMPSRNRMQVMNTYGERGHLQERRRHRSSRWTASS